VIDLERVNYLVQRIGRNFLPGPVARLGRRLFRLVPGPETAWPDETAERYLRVAAEAGRPVEGRRVMLFGSGPSFAVACRLLRAGAERVVLYDKFARPDDRINGPLVADYPDLVGRVDGRVAPVTDRMVLVEPATDDDATAFPEVDVILSSSVLEHVDDVEGWARRLAAVTAPGGVNLHLVDLRDHFFSTPFEMLRYSERTWSRWLNPRGHLNRYRIPDYERAFRTAFERVSIEITRRDEAAFEAARRWIRPELLTGDDAVDAATIVLLRAEQDERAE
jgi:hypothetical protein